MPKELPSWETADVGELAPFARVRLIVVDLDGTLVGPGTSELNVMAASLARGRRVDAPVEVTVATGRALAGARPFVEALRLKGNLPIILYNGSVVLGAQSYSPLLLRHIPPTALTEIVDICHRSRARLLAYYFSKHGAHWFTATERVLGWATGKRLGTEFNGLQVEWNSWTKRPPSDVDERGPVAVVVDARGGDHTSLKASLGSVAGISLTGSGSSLIEIRPEGSNKGAALGFVAQHLGLAMGEVLAVGDNDNDVEMLLQAGIGVAVAGASPAAAANSDFRCRHQVEAGVVEILRIVHNARRYERASHHLKTRTDD